MGKALAFGHRQRSLNIDAAVIDEIMAGVLLAQQFGKDWYVNSAASSGGDGRTPDSAFTTLAAALAASASGDRIWLAAGHAETISAAGGITWSQSGRTVIGLGSGATRPTFTWSATDSTFLITGANNILCNVRCKVSIDEVVVLFGVSGVGNILDRVDFVETASAQARRFATFSAADCALINSNHIQVNAAGAAQIWIATTAADRFRLVGNHFQLALNDAATSAVYGAVTTQSVNVLLAYNACYITGYSANLLSVFLTTNGTTGIVKYNDIYANVAANTTINDMPGCASFQNMCTNALDKSGILDPVADT